MSSQRLHPLVHDLLEQRRQGKIDRRQFLRFSTMLGLSATAAASLGGPGSLGRAWAAGPRRGGTLKISALVQKLTHPAQLSWPEPSNPLRQVAQHLTVVDEKNMVHPKLLEKWSVSDDLKTWTLFLKKGVKFNNGDDFTAEDVAFTIGQWLDPEVKSSMLGLMGGYLEPSGVEKKDPHTVVLHLKKPEIGLPYHLYHYPAVILNHKTFEGDFLKAPHGTGPYTLETYRPGEICALKARQDYWRKGADGQPLPYLEGLEFIDLGKDMAPRIAALKNGEVHMVDQGSQSGPDVMLALKGQAGFNTIVFHSATTKLLRIRSDVAPWSDPRVRRALKLCQNREKIKALAFQNTGLLGADCHVYELHPEYCPMEPPKYDPEQAKALLAEAGLDKGLDAELFVGSMFPDAVRQAEILKQDAEPAGFRLTIRPTPKYFEKWTEYHLGITPWGHRALGTMCLNLAYTADAQGQPVPWNETHWIDQEFLGLLDQANQAIDVEARRKIFCQLEKIQQERGSVGIVNFEDMYLCTSDKVQNVHTQTPYLDIDEVWLAG